MKTVFAALAIFLVAAAPAIASETSNVVSGVSKSATVQMVAVMNAAPVPVAQVASTKKVRIVLASPFGN
ncbi:hypothetical protein MKK84_23880 [Methylobacterium sp. E-065]|uniref:hypothetical protein n=1 Tax=Methylobacterium sp. E-065 TaxID=2836583 RepID=UPI001FBB61D1|nr:hypothetical protein [Methylobacterium sp. E-065]MCJ2020432.1 hypothetical protein [Methylobacterium sp. E-065]